MDYKDDFYTFVNSKWLNNNKIPDDYPKWNVFSELQEDINKKLNKILKSDNIDNNIKIIYKQYNNSKIRFNNNNLLILNKIINIINKSDNHFILFEEMFKLSLLLNISLPINISINSDYKNSHIMIPHINTNGLGLPDRDYYFNKNNNDIIIKYKQFINDYLKLFNIDIDINYIYNIELILAEKTYTNVESSNIELLYNIYNFNEFIIKYPNLQFLKYIFEYNKIKPGIININNPKFIELLNNLIPTIKLEYWKNYFIFRTLLIFHNCINEDIDKCFFNFYSKTLYGIIIQKPLWKRSIYNISNLLGELLGKEYIKLYFNNDTKKHIYKIISLIKNELYTSINTNEWMENITKEKALNKLNKINIKIGYPDKYIKNYNNLKLNNNNSYLQNLILIYEFDFKYDINKLYKNPDKYEWHMNPYDINAYYSPSKNEIVFPAAILQKPFFSLNQDMATNFGGIGMIIGHEIIHGFDDNGSKFDKDGNYNNWWTHTDLEKYNKILEKVIKQYNENIIDGTPLNGELTLGENVSDLGGINLSMKAMLTYYNNNDNDKLKLFFINYAKIWRSKSRKQYIQQQLITDPHSPPNIRVNNVLKNIDNFYNVFNIKPNNKLYLEPNKRINIW